MVVGVVLVGRVPVGVFFSVEGSEEHGYGKYVIYYYNILWRCLLKMFHRNAGLDTGTNDC